MTAGHAKLTSDLTDPPSGAFARAWQAFRHAPVRNQYSARIKALAQRGHGAGAIARRLGLNPGTVRSILVHLGLFKPRGIHPLKEKVRPLVEGGLTLHEAAKVLGVSPTVAKYHYKQAGGEPVRPASRWPGSPRRAAELLKDLEAYRQRTEIAWKKLAARCALNASVIWPWRAGRQVPSDYTLDKVERFLAGEKE